MFNGVALIIAVAFAVWRQRRAGTTSREAPPSVTEDLAAPAISPDGNPESMSREPGHAH
jgi:hypothetical protein